jgi:hypothetical protein
MTIQRSTIFALGLILSLVCLVSHAEPAADRSALFPEDTIRELELRLSEAEQKSSAARQRLSLRRVINEAEDLLSANASAPNRFLVQSTLFRSLQQMVKLDNSERNRKAFLEAAKQLAAAPDTYAAIRFEADLLVAQAQAARQGIDPADRAAAMLPLVERYYDTEIEAKAFQIALLIANETGNNEVVLHLCHEITRRIPNNIELIQFQRDKLGGHVFGAAFVGNYEDVQGNTYRFPMDFQGVTTGVYFWSKENGGIEDLKEFAQAWNNKVASPDGDVTDWYRIVSVNVDELPDAGESILRELGLDWRALRLPGGPENELFKTYGRFVPRTVTVSPTGYVALSLSEGAPHRGYERDLNEMLSQTWVNPRSNSHLQSILAGEFLIHGPQGEFDPSSPPELKAASSEGLPDVELPWIDASVPADVLEKIQSCFIAPPARYRLPIDQARAHYEKADDLCRQAISAYPDAPNLWVVRNRRIVALQVLWKLTNDYGHFAAAARESKAALEGGYPAGTDVIARFCLARASFRSPEAVPQSVIAEFLQGYGPEPSGPALAAAALLAIDVGDRKLHEAHRRAFLDKFAASPSMWTATNFFLNRHQRFWLYQPPYTGPDWLSYSAQEKHAISSGAPEDVRRTINLELTALDETKVNIPKDFEGKWVIVEFQSPQVSKVYMQSYASFPSKRPADDLVLITAYMSEDSTAANDQNDKFLEVLKRRGLDPSPFHTMLVPGGLENPVVQELGLLDEDVRTNLLLIHPDGAIAAMITGDAIGRTGSIMHMVVDWHDEKRVDDALARGDIEEAKRLAFMFAPPQLVDQQSKRPKTSIPHLRSRAKVYFAMGELASAAADAEQLYLRAKDTAKRLNNIRTEELKLAEKLKSDIETKSNGHE